MSGYDKTVAEGFTDYCLYNDNGEVLAVVEAKHTRRDARVGREQVLEYVTKIEKQQSFRPFAFMANGYDVFSGKASRRRNGRPKVVTLPIAGSTQPEDLELLES